MQPLLPKLKAPSKSQTKKHSHSHGRNYVGDTGDASPHFFRQWGYNMPCRPTFSLVFVIHWFHTKLSPSYFTTKFCSCSQQT